MTTLVVDVSEELKARLHEVAKEQGVAIDDLVRRVLETFAASGRGVVTAALPQTRDERADRIEAVVAKYAHLPGSVDAFLREKHEETEREEERRARWRREGEPR